jgi:hypothetical protein
MTDTDLYAGFIRMHLLDHAAIEPFFGLGLIEALLFHGDEFSAGTLCCLLRGLGKKGHLASHAERDGRSGQRAYGITEACARQLAAPRIRVQEFSANRSTASCGTSPRAPSSSGYSS